MRMRVVVLLFTRAFFAFESERERSRVECAPFLEQFKIFPEEKSRVKVHLLLYTWSSIKGKP